MVQIHPVNADLVEEKNVVETVLCLRQAVSSVHLISLAYYDFLLARVSMYLVNEIFH